MSQERARELLVGELAALVGIEDLGASVEHERRFQASIQKQASMELESLQASTRREHQSMIATR